MTITKVIKDLIETNTYNEIVSNIGNTQPVTINSIVFANTTFVNTSNTSMLTTGGYFKLYGNNYQSGANVYLDKYLASNTQYISSNELRVTFSTIPSKTYSLFLYNPNGSNSIKYNSFLVQGNNTLGYIAGGTGQTAPGPSNNNPLSSVERITYSNDTITPNLRGNLPSVRAVCYGFSTNQNGYVSIGRSGTSSASGVLSNTIKILYNNDTAAATSFGPFSFSPGLGTLSFGSSLQNSIYGYYAGGYGGPSQNLLNSSILRMEFANDSSAPISRSTMESARAYTTGVFNNNNGWIIGGATGTVYNSFTSTTNQGVSIISRMDFSADTNVTIVRGPTGTNFFAGQSVYDNNYGWFTGGMASHTLSSAPTSVFASVFSNTLKRLDFNNDTVTSTTRVPTATGAGGNFLGSSLEDGEYGWFVGGVGTIPSPAPLPSVPSPFASEWLDYSTSVTTTSLVSRMTFSNDTVSLSSRGTLNTDRKGTTSFNGINT